MFVALTQFERNLKLNFNDKESLASLAAAKVPLPVSDCVSKTDGAIPHTNYFLMLTEKKIVTDSETAKVTPFCAETYHAQQFYQTIANFFQIADVSDFNEAQNELLNTYLNQEDASQIPFQEIQNVVYITTCQTQFISALKESWCKFVLTNNIQID